MGNSPGLLQVAAAQPAPTGYSWFGRKRFGYGTGDAEVGDETVRVILQAAVFSVIRDIQHGGGR